ncbi:U32 family peptidase [Candidatus Woesearchaeota archaeon]|nr:U32 family peptidase [Candidatus Woesearchaeota archaeon]
MNNFKNNQLIPSIMVELLAPVSDRIMLKAAIDAGADAVYFGLKKLNMRATGKNFTLEELPEIVKQCHDNKVRVFLTVNSIVYNEELAEIKKIVKGAKGAGVDAIICWDMAVIQECKKQNIEFHISTQASVSNIESAQFYKDLGATRVVLARELNLNQITEIIEKTDIEVETFIHGAMCVSVSGRCFTSQYLFNKSANRGDCLQPCRREYRIIDISEKDKELVLGENYIMSPKDLCALPFLDKLIKAGIVCFKIEGRVRSPEYVKTVTAVYREAIDAVEKGIFNEELIKKLTEKLKTVYNRGFSTGFYLGSPTNDDFTDKHGSKALTKKVYVGFVKNFLKKIMVAEVKVESDNLRIGDKIMIQGPTTGVQEQILDSMQINHKPINEAEKTAVGIKLNFIARENDKVFVIKPLD